MAGDSRWAPSRIVALDRGPADMAELREFCELWRVGDEAFWPFDSVTEALGRQGVFGLVAKAGDDPSWLGVVLCQAGDYSADVLYLFVKTEARGLGIGYALLTALMAELQQRPRLEALFLEVRVGNVAARNLYESLGMREIGRRKGYYRGREDALVMRLDLLPESSSRPGGP